MGWDFPAEDIDDNDGATDPLTDGCLQAFPAAASIRRFEDQPYQGSVTRRGADYRGDQPKWSARDKRLGWRALSWTCIDKG